MRWSPILLAAPVLARAAGGARGTGGNPSLVHTVQRGDLVITVRERAEVHAAQDTRVSSRLEGQATLIDLVAEGTVVRAGDKLAELDASAIEEKRANQAITVAKAEAALLQARKNYEILEKELQAAEATAASRLEIALMRTEKFLGEKAEAAATGTNRELLQKLRQMVAQQGADDPKLRAKGADLADRLSALLEKEDNLDLAMGEMANQVLQSIDEISLAAADLEMAKDTLFHSEKLASRGFITQNELVRDQIHHRRQLSKVTVAWNNLQLLIKYTLPETLITLQQEVENARLGLESVRAANEARRVREAAELKASEAEFELARERLDNWNQQVRNAVLRAPGPGLVVYGRWDWDEPVYEGMQVREGQEVIILPDITKMIAEIKVHEAQIDKVAVGQPATVKVDAFPERTFIGKVSRVSTLPDPNRRSRDLKVFGVKVLLDEDNSSGTLRPGMNATVVVDVGTLAGVLLIPLPAVERRADRHFVWKVTPDGPVATEVQLGGNNLTHVEVVSGLREGDRIWLVRPAGARLPDAGDGAEDAPAADDPTTTPPPNGHGAR